MRPVAYPDNRKFNLITILGPTASGKTRLAAVLAFRIGGEILSADSRQVYRGMDLGTGKDYEDYKIEGEQIAVHLVDIVDAGYKYNIYEYQRDFVSSFQQVVNRNKIPILCGGSGMYIEGILKGYKLIHVPVNRELRRKLENRSMEDLTDMLSSFRKLHNVTDTDTRKRLIRAIEIATYYSTHPEIDPAFPEIKPVVFGINVARDIRRKRISERLERRLKEGMIDEVKGLIRSGIHSDRLIYYGLEYKFITKYLQGVYTREEMHQKLETAIHRFAKRQMTWFRGMEKREITIHWLDGNSPVEENVDRIISVLDKL
ncbi:MAG: tRNA (adenosine(37)-N6)-dimethylallyltransferase MiaA [Bacteroidales bacterium]|nr:MAG: tRNA (adenosine(37)-N6)-dimethylallyltransferase MiaA [Bacteroidales bacterium]